MAGKRKKQSGIGVRHLVEGVLLTAALALLLMPGGPAGAVPVAQDEAEACVSGQQISSQVPETEAPQVPEASPGAGDQSSGSPGGDGSRSAGECRHDRTGERAGGGYIFFRRGVPGGFPDGGLPSVQRTAGGASTSTRWVPRWRRYLTRPWNRRTQARYPCWMRWRRWSAARCM